MILRPRRGPFALRLDADPPGAGPGVHDRRFSTEDTVSKRTERPKKILRCIKYGATWCGPCFAFKPTFAKFQAAHPDLAIECLDVDKLTPAQDRERIKLFGEVMSIPMVVFVYGEKTLQVPGAVSLRELEDAWAQFKWKPKARRSA